MCGGGGGGGGGRIEGLTGKKFRDSLYTIIHKIPRSFQDPSSSHSLDILLTRFSYCNNSKVCKGA